MTQRAVRCGGYTLGENQEVRLWHVDGMVEGPAGLPLTIFSVRTTEKTAVIPQ